MKFNIETKMQQRWRLLTNRWVIVAISAIILSFAVSSCVPPANSDGRRVVKNSQKSNRNYTYSNSKKSNAQIDDYEDEENSKLPDLTEFENKLTKKASSKKLPSVEEQLSALNKKQQKTDDAIYETQESIKNLKGELIEIKRQLGEMNGYKQAIVAEPQTTNETPKPSQEQGIALSFANSKKEKKDSDYATILSDEEDNTPLNAQPTPLSKPVVSPTTQKKVTNNTANSKSTSKRTTKNPSTPTSSATIASDINLSEINALVIKGDYANATTQIKKILNSAKDHTTIANCNYLLGECAFNQKEYAQAINYYKQAIAKNTSNKDSAQAKIAESYMRVGKTSDAKIEYQKLLIDYPRSIYSATAKKMLQQL